MDHDDLDMFLDRAISAYRRGDRDAARAAFSDLEARLASHFELEERQLFPECARVEPQEIAALRKEHDAIRAQVGELGIETDLHQMHPSAIEGLANLLRHHAARENTLLYRWADRVMADPDRAYDGPVFLRPQAPTEVLR